MFNTTIHSPGGAKLYFAVHSKQPAQCFLEIKSGEISEFYFLKLQKKTSYFIVRQTTGACELRFKAEVPIDALVYPRQRKPPVAIKLLELLDDFRRKQATLWTEIRTENGIHLREITLGRFMPSAYSRSERLLFHCFRLLEVEKHSEKKIRLPCDHILSRDLIRNILTSLEKSGHQEFILGVDETKFNPENHGSIQEFVFERFVDHSIHSGPAWDFMRKNPKIGMLYWTGENVNRLTRYYVRAIRTLASILDIDITSLETTLDLPPIFLIRTDALLWISALDIGVADVDSGLYDAQSLQRLLPAIIQNAGYAIAPLPDFNNLKNMGRSVKLAKWVGFRHPVTVAGVDVCLFVGLLNNQNRFTEYALTYMQELKKQGIFVYALGVSLSDPDFAEDPGAQYSDAFAARANDGHDFGLWAAAIKRTPEVWNANSLLLTNDSIFPASYGFDELFNKIKNSEYDVTGLTESTFGSRHIQSFFVHLNRNALQTHQVKEFWDSVLSWKNKGRIISLYEIGMTSKFMTAGLKCGALYNIKKHSGNASENPTLRNWQELITLGFPFVKIQILKENIGSQQERDVLDFLERNGFSREIIGREFQKLNGYPG